MKHAVIRFLTAGLAVCLLSAPISGHHEIAAKFDPAKTVTLRGVVTGVEWLNPHVHIYMNVPGARGITNWAVELESVVDLRESGWRQDSVKPGDTVSVEGIVARVFTAYFNKSVLQYVDASAIASSVWREVCAYRDES